MISFRVGGLEIAENIISILKNAPLADHPLLASLTQAARKDFGTDALTEDPKRFLDVK